MQVIATKTKPQNLSIRARLSFAESFEFATDKSPRDFTRSLSLLVRYPKLIYDIGRSVDSSRLDEDRYRFEIRQKRYLGRGTYAISARAVGLIHYDEETGITVIEGYSRLGGQYMLLLSFMTLLVVLSLVFVYYTILFLPLAVLMLMVIGLHWGYLFADKRELLQRLDDLINERSIETDYDINLL